MNTPTRVLAACHRCCHALLLCEIQQLVMTKDPAAIGRAIEVLKRAKLITWTTQGWLITEAGKTFSRTGNRLSFERMPRQGDRA